MARSYLKYGSKTYYLPASPTDLTWSYRLNTSSTDTWGGKVIQILSCTVGPLSLSGQLPPRVTSQGREGAYAELDRFVEFIVGAMNYQEERWRKGRSIKLHVELSDMFEGTTYIGDSTSLDFSVYIDAYPGITKSYDTGVPEFRLAMSVIEGSSIIQTLTSNAYGDTDSLSNFDREVIASLREIQDINWRRSKYSAPSAYGEEGDSIGRDLNEARFELGSQGVSAWGNPDAPSLELRDSIHTYMAHESPVSIGRGFGFPWYDFRSPVADR